jgi:hypothetical protein
MHCNEYFLSVAAQLRFRHVLHITPRHCPKAQRSPTTVLTQGLWEHWCLWRQQPGRAASHFGDWVKASCCVEEKAGFNVFLNEVVSLIVPQLLLNRPPHSAEQVQNATNARIHSPFGFDQAAGAFSMPPRSHPSFICGLPAPPGALVVEAGPRHNTSIHRAVGHKGGGQPHVPAG